MQGRDCGSPDDSAESHTGPGRCLPRGEGSERGEGRSAQGTLARELGEVGGVAGLICSVVL